MRFIRSLLFLLVIFFTEIAFGQDVDLYLTDHYLAGKSIIKMNRDFDDPYMWVLVKNNEVYRLNTITKQLDDYTLRFQIFTGYQIFDIAGIGQERVTLAIKNADSTMLVNYNNGVISYPLRNNFYGVQGNLVAIGASAIYTELSYGFVDHPALLIATDKGFYRYTFDTGVINYNGSSPSQIYSATYRDQMFIVNNQTDTSGFNLTPVFGISAGPNDFPGVLRTGGVFGSTINTAYFTVNQVFNSPSFFSPDAFWGNDKGLFQEKLRNTSPFLSRFRHYLDNIKINKITDILGLIPFGNNGAKENLLVGTDKGLYYSNSFLHAGSDSSLDNLTLYHFDKLGNIPINFVEVNAKSTIAPFCEDGIWVATNDGLYLVKPDWASHLNQGQLVSSIHFKDQDNSITNTHICAGDSTIAQLNADIVANTIQWFKNGSELINENNTVLMISTPGEYYAILYDPCEGIHLESNHLKVDVIFAPVFSFNYPAKMAQCNNNPLELKTDNNPVYHYRWYTNGVLNGDTTSIFTVIQTGKYKVEVSACTNSWVPSKEVEVDLVNLPVPQITSNKSVYCANDEAALSLNIPTDASYTINWYCDGSLLTGKKDSTAIKTNVAGNYTVTLTSIISSCSQPSAPQQLVFTPAPVFTFDYPDELRYCAGTPTTLKVAGSAAYQYRWYKDGTLTGDVTAALNISQPGKYKVEVSACDGSWVPSKEVKIDFVQLPIPVITTDKPAYCIGDNATLSIAVPPSTSYTIKWYKDDVQLANSTNQLSLITSIGGNYTVSVVNNEANSDGSTCSQVSSPQSLVFNPAPIVTIEQIVRTTLCDGQTVNLKAHYNGGTVKWSTGETTDQISVSTPDNYKVTVTSAAGCQVDANADISFFANPILNIPDAGVCVPSHKTATLTAPAGLASYIWNGQPGTETFIADRPQTVTLMVIDANGCQGTQEIQVIDECPNVHIPNTFTPNGDGINDTWQITGLEFDPTALVQVFSRYGQQVYESKGYGIAWNGQNKGKKMGTGTYYYIITTKNGRQKFSGYVTIIY
jgi:gliding motility-associated-like protein